MRNKSIVWSACLIVLALVSNLYAGPAEDLLSQKWGTQDSRRKEALKEVTGFKKLDSATPTLSPGEETWLQTEYDRELEKHNYHPTKRSLRAAQSKEYDIRKTKAHTFEIIRLLHLLSNKNMDQKHEIRQWAQLASLYMDQEYWWSVGALSAQWNILDKDFELNGIKVATESNGVMETAYNTFGCTANEILDYVIIPYLSDQEASKIIGTEK